MKASRDVTGEPVVEPAVVVRRSSRRRKTLSAHREGDVIVVAVPALLTRRDEQRLVPGLVARVLEKERHGRAPGGDAALRARADELAARYLDAEVGFPVRAHDVRWVRNQNTRWGSCTPSRRTIRLTRRLQTMPSWVVDAVLVHELTHLVEPDHSAGFRRLAGAYEHAERAKGFLEGYDHALSARITFEGSGTV